MPSWRDRLIAAAGPSFLGGLRAGDWLQLLRDNRFAVDLRYLPRAVSITGFSLLNSCFAWLEKARYASKLDQVVVEPPLFILGHWRSGTTLLFNLLALDERVASPTLFEVLFPHTFLVTEPILSRLLAPLMPPTRPSERRRFRFDTPHEEEFAICLMSLCSSHLSMAFPRREEYYERYNTLREVSPAELRAWQTALVTFLKKLTLKYGRRLVLKSPAHTGRIRILLEMFPQAKFVHIHRNPYEVFQSARWTMTRSSRWQRLQRRDCESFDERTLRQYQEIYEAFFAQRGLIPSGQYHEVAFEDLERDPVGEMGKLYQRLCLGGFEAVEPALSRHAQSLAGYRKNVFDELPRDLRDRIALEWRQSFEEWGYPTQ